MIYNCQSLENLNGLEGISGTISGGIFGINLEGNTELKNIDSLSGISVISGQLKISRNSSLTQINGLCNVISIGSGGSGYLSIMENDSLINLYGLRNLLELNGYFSIIANPVLPTCEAEYIYNQLLENGYTGEASIGINDDNGICQ